MNLQANASAKAKEQPSQHTKTKVNMDRQGNNGQRSTTSNRRLTKVAFQSSVDSFVVNQSLVLRNNICGKNSHLRQAPNR